MAALVDGVAQLTPHTLMLGSVVIIATKGVQEGDIYAPVNPRVVYRVLGFLVRQVAGEGDEPKDLQMAASQLQKVCGDSRVVEEMTLRLTELTSPDDVYELLEEVSALCESEGDATGSSCLVSPSSVIGQFVRTVRVAFLSDLFSQLAALFTSLQEYCGTASTPVPVPSHSTSPISPPAHWKQYLQHLHSRQYHETIHSLHRFFDYFISSIEKREPFSADEDGISGGVSYAPYILVTMAATQQQFGFLLESRDALIEAIALAQERKNLPGLAYALRWWMCLTQSEGEPTGVMNSLDSHSPSAAEHLGVAAQRLQFATSEFRSHRLPRDILESILASIDTGSSDETQHIHWQTHLMRACLWTSVGDTQAAFAGLRLAIRLVAEIHSIAPSPIGASDLVPPVCFIAQLAASGHLAHSRDPFIHALELLESVSWCTGEMRNTWWTETVWTVLFHWSLNRGLLSNAEHYLNLLRALSGCIDSHVPGGFADQAGILRHRVMSVRVLSARGRLTEAIELCEHSILLCSNQRRYQFQVSFKLLLAEAYRKAASPEISLPHALESLAISKERGLGGLQARAELELAEIRLLLSPSHGSDASLTAASRAVLQCGDPGMTAQLHHLQARTLLMRYPGARLSERHRTDVVTHLQESLRLYHRLVDLPQYETVMRNLARTHKLLDQQSEAQDCARRVNRLRRELSQPSFAVPVVSSLEVSPLPSCLAHHRNFSSWWKEMMM